MEKILLVNDFNLGGGAEGVFRDTYALLKENGNFVDVFYGEKKATDPSSVFSYLYNTKVKKNLENKLDSYEPTIIHIHNYYHFLSPAIFLAIKKYKKQRNVKVVFTAHDYHLICPSSGMMTFSNNQVTPIGFEKHSFPLFKSIDHRGWKYSFMKKIYWIWSIKILRILNLIDEIISPSEFLAQTFINFGIKTPINIVRNPFKGKVPTDLLKTKPLCSKEIRLLFIGRLSQEKGLYSFLDAFSKLKYKQNLRLDVLGEGNEAQKLKNLISFKGIDNVTFHGFKSGNELERFLIKSNVLLLPSVWYENAPLSIIEGAAYGNIILAKNLGGMVELSKKSKQYVLIDDWELELENAIEKLRKLPCNELVDVSKFSDVTYVNLILKCYSK
jgi:glycosyltransferase involved in cell wall biosynthesis